MSFIKLFDAYFDKSDSYFEIITYDQLTSMSKEIQQITYGEISTIKEIFGFKKIETSYQSKKISTDVTNDFLPRDIYKLEDDWWVLRMSSNKIPVGCSLPTVLCDGIEGMRIFNEAKYDAFKNTGWHKFLIGTGWVKT